MKHVQHVGISLITGKPATAFRKFGHQLGFCHADTVDCNSINAATANKVPCKSIRLESAIARRSVHPKSESKSGTGRLGQRAKS